MEERSVDREARVEAVKESLERSRKYQQKDPAAHYPLEATTYVSCLETL